MRQVLEYLETVKFWIFLKMPSFSPLSCTTTTKKKQPLSFHSDVYIAIHARRQKHVRSAKLSLKLQPYVIHQKFEEHLIVIQRYLQRHANFLSLFPSICQEAACQINNLVWLRHHRKTKPSVISTTLLITNNKILAKTNGSVIILVNFSLP